MTVNHSIFTIAAMINPEVKRKNAHVCSQKKIFCHSLLSCSTNLKYIKRDRCLIAAVIIVVILFASIKDPKPKKLLTISL
jgi:hypothetical protein